MSRKRDARTTEKCPSTRHSVCPEGRYAEGDLERYILRVKIIVVFSFCRRNVVFGKLCYGIGSEPCKFSDPASRTKCRGQTSAPHPKRAWKPYRLNLYSRPTRAARLTAQKHPSWVGTRHPNRDTAKRAAALPPPRGIQNGGHVADDAPLELVAGDPVQFGQYLRASIRQGTPPSCRPVRTRPEDRRRAQSAGAWPCRSPARSRTSRCQARDRIAPATPDTPNRDNPAGPRHSPVRPHRRPRDRIGVRAPPSAHASRG